MFEYGFIYMRNHPHRDSLLKQSRGFTLIEIIAVMVIIGILAAVATPKYIDLVSDAELKVVSGVKAELQSRANMYYAKYLLDSTSTLNTQSPSAWAAESVGTDFAISLAGTDLKVTPQGSTNSFKIPLTPGTNNAPAKFGQIEKIP